MNVCRETVALLRHAGVTVTRWGACRTMSPSTPKNFKFNWILIRAVFFYSNYL